MKKIFYLILLTLIFTFNISSAEKRIVILPDAGHHTFHGQPELFNEAIEEFIK